MVKVHLYKRFMFPNQFYLCITIGSVVCMLSMHFNGMDNFQVLVQVDYDNRKRKKLLSDHIRCICSVLMLK